MAGLLSSSLIRRDQAKAKIFFLKKLAMYHFDTTPTPGLRGAHSCLMEKTPMKFSLFPYYSYLSDGRGLNILQESSVCMVFLITSLSPANEIQNISKDCKASKLPFTYFFKLWC